MILCKMYTYDLCMNHAEIIHIEAKHFLMNTARNNYNLASVLSKCLHAISSLHNLFDNQFDNYNL